MDGQRIKNLGFALVLGSLLAACSAPSFLGGSGQSPQEIARNQWRDGAELRCLGTKGLFVTALIERKDPIDGPGACGIRRPFKLTGTNTGMVDITPSATLNCQMVVATQEWIRRVVQPAAMLRFGQPVTKVHTMGSYGCRTRNHRKGAKLSEHSFGNALDVGGFTLAGGRKITVKKGWDSFFGISRESSFLRAVHRNSCGLFKTVLGPDSDRFHKDHFHFDLARHNSKGTSYCR